MTKDNDNETEQDIVRLEKQVKSNKWYYVARWNNDITIPYRHFSPSYVSFLSLLDTEYKWHELVLTANGRQFQRGLKHRDRDDVT